MARIQMNGVRKSFGDVHVIKGVDLDIRAGEFMVFVGPSGCGKSTLLRLIAGLEDITGGEMRFDDQVVNDKTPSERGIAMVFQSYALYPHMTVYDNMAFGLRLAKGQEAETRKRVERAAEMLQIKPYLDRLPRALSGGQRQRVAIGRAIVRDPRVFLFDEPLSNLDAALRVATRLEIAKLHHDMGKATMIYVTHDQVEAMTLADRICVLRDGLVEQVGTPLELYERPASVFVAGFIGSPQMNFLSGEHAAPLGAHMVGVRPEHLAAAPEGQGAWAGVVAHREMMGSDTYLYVDVGGPSLITLREPGISTRNPGERIAFAPTAPHYVHRFNEAGRPV